MTGEFLLQLLREREREREREMIKCGRQKSIVKKLLVKVLGAGAKAGRSIICCRLLGCELTRKSLLESE